MPLVIPHPPFEVRPAQPGTVFYRLLNGSVAYEEDFWSDEMDGRTQNLPRTQSMALYRGFSVRATLPQARSLAKSLRKTHIAEIVLDWEEADAVARTSHTKGHHTVWADPESIYKRVRDVHEV